jgi:porin
MRTLLAFPPVAALLAVISPVAAEPVVKLGASYTGDLLGAVAGSDAQGFDLVGRADAWADFDAPQLGLPNLSGHLDLMAVHGPDFSGRRVGAYQVISSIEADTVPHVYEAWAQWKSPSGFSAKAGLIDLNAEFDVQATGTLFVNSAFGIGPDISQSGLAGPSIFPMPSTAAIVRAEHGRTAVAFGVFDALAGARHDPRKLAVRWPGTTGALLIAEAKVPVGSWALQFGGWHYTTRFDALDAARPPASSQGIYGMVEGAIARGVSVWLRIGAADSRANPIGSYAGGGAVAIVNGWRLGVAAGHARLGSAARRNLYVGGHAARAETVVELTAQRAITNWLQIQPDLQYVVHPGWNPAADNVLVAGLRFSLALPHD